MQTWPTSLYIAAATLALVAVLLIVRSRRRHRSYIPRALLTPNELEFWHRLRRALPDYSLFTQVAMSALIEPAVAKSDKRFWQLRSKFAQKFVDYVVTDPATLAVIAIIELDDRTHDKQKDAERDAMLNDAGYTVVRWESTAKPSIREIAEVIGGLAR